jgi:hypothetical protein
MEKPVEFPVITSEELFSSYHTMLQGAPPLPPEDDVEFIEGPPPAPFVIPIWDVQNQIAPPNIVIPQIWPFLKFAFPRSRFLPWDGTHDWVDLFGSVDSPSAWAASEQDESGETRINSGALVDLMQAIDPSYPHEFDNNETDEDFLSPPVDPNLDDRCAIFPPSRHCQAEEE